MATQNKVFRFKFSDIILEHMKEFARIHKFDERNDFKEAWELWTQTNADMITEESKRLTNLGFIGDINDKMYKSVRYYYRKKSNIKHEPKQRRKYTSFGKDVLSIIDRHIISSIEENDEFKPSDGFSDFIKNNSEIIGNTFDKLQEEGLEKEDIDNKFKKTYKNRYFIIKNKV